MRRSINYNNVNYNKQLLILIARFQEGVAPAAAPVVEARLVPLDVAAAGAVVARLAASGGQADPGMSPVQGGRHQAKKCYH